MRFNTELTRKLGIRGTRSSFGVMYLTNSYCFVVPIVQGGMYWVGYAELAAAVSNAGSLGLVNPPPLPLSQIFNEVPGDGHNSTFSCGTTKRESKMEDDDFQALRCEHLYPACYQSTRLFCLREDCYRGGHPHRRNRWGQSAGHGNTMKNSGLCHNL